MSKDAKNGIKWILCMVLQVVLLHGMMVSFADGDYCFSVAFAALAVLYIQGATWIK